MELFEAILKRHSYRGAFLDQPVPREHLQQILQAGIQAPSGCNAQTTSFVAVDDPATLAAIGQILEDRPVARGARAMIVCLVEHRPVFQGMSFGVEDCAAAVENMLLAVTALGYATVWLDGVLRTGGRAARIGALLDVPPHMEVRVLLPLGVPRETIAQREKKPFAERAWFNRYGQS